MGTLVHGNTGRQYPLAARTLVGRAPSCTVRLDDALASKEHALVSWVRGQWLVRDLDSRNGTSVDGVVLPPGQMRALEHGTRLSFAGATDVFVVSDVSPPGFFAQHAESQQVVQPVDGILFLPRSEAPDDHVLVSVDINGVVLVDDGGEARREAASLVQVGRETWRVYVPESPLDETPLPPFVRVQPVRYHFLVPRNEERVSLSVVLDTETVLLSAREHLYLLLMLARARWAEQHLPEPDRGWVHRDRLRADLRMEDTALRVAVHRARAQLMLAGVPNAESIVETRRPYLRRFGSDHVKFVSVD